MKARNQPTDALVEVEGLRKAIWKDLHIAPCSKTIESLRKRGLIPAITTGRRFYYSVPAVRAALEKLSAKARVR